MDFSEVVIGHTQLGNPMKAFMSKNFYNDSWLYLLAGIHGNEIEGIYLLNELLPWLKESIKLTLPVILVQVIDLDGHLIQNNPHGKQPLLNHLFPKASFTNMLNYKKLIPNSIDRPEISALMQLMTAFPPQMVINFRTAKNQPKVVAIGQEGLGLGSYLAKILNYPLLADSKPALGTIEAMVYHFFLKPVVGIRLPHFTPQKTVISICSEVIPPIKQLLLGQIY